MGELTATNFSFVFEAGIEIGEGTSPDPDPERLARASNDVDSDSDGERGLIDKGLMADAEFGGGVEGMI